MHAFEHFGFVITDNNRSESGVGAVPSAVGVRVSRKVGRAACDVTFAKKYLRLCGFGEVLYLLKTSASNSVQPIDPSTMEKLAQTNHAREKRNLDLFRMLMMKGTCFFTN